MKRGALVRTCCAAVLAGGMAHVAGLIAGAADPRQTRTPPLPAYRPSSLSDLVDAVSANRDGLDDVDLSGDVADHSLFLGDGVGIAARLREDPDGPVFVAWQERRQPWRYRHLDDDDIEKVRVPGAFGARLGRVAQFRPAGRYFVLETHTADGVTASVVMRSDLSPLAFVAGAVIGVVPADVLVVRRTIVEGTAHTDVLDRIDARTGRIDAIYPAQRRVPGTAGASSQQATSTGLAIRDAHLDVQRATVSFSVVPAASPSPTPPGRVRLICALTTVPVRCEPAREEQSSVGL